MHLFLRHTFLFLWLTFGLYATSLSNQEENITDINLSKDLDNMSNAELTTYLYEISLKLSDELEKTFQTLFKKHHADQVFQSKIKASQIQWEKYMKAELEMIFPHMDDDRYHWSGAGQCYYKYKNLLIQNRIDWLKTFEKSLQLDGCSSNLTD